MDYFWKQQDDIPYGLGYPLFGREHILSTSVTLGIVVLMALCFLKMDRRKQKIILKGIPLFMVFLEVFKDIFLVSVHRFGVWYLPLHVCSIGIFVFLLREFLPWKKAKEIFGEVAVILIMPGSVAALVFPDWTVYYPVVNFINFHSYVWHGLLVLYPVLLILTGETRPSVKHFHYVLIFLCMTVLPIYAFDKHFGVNYFFVNWPEKDTPLEWFAEYLGNPGYLIGYGSLAISVMLIEYLIIFLIRKIRSCDPGSDLKI